MTTLPRDIAPGIAPTARPAADPPTSVSIGSLFSDMPLTRMHWQAGLVLFVVFVIESWEMMVIVFGAASIGTEFHVDAAQVGSLIGSIFLGMIPGALVWGRLGDILGRRRSIALSLAAYGAISLLSSFAPNYEVLWWLRFACGVVLAGVLVITFPYFEELLPVKVRGRAAVYLASGWPVGLLIAIGVAQAFGDQGWRWAVAASSLAGLWSIAVLLWVPESPYWLFGKGRHAEAKAVVLKLSNGAVSSPLPLAPLTAVVSGGATIELFRGRHLPITVVQIVVNFCFSWGYWALSSWMPVLLAKKGLSAPQGYGFMALSALFMFPGYVCASFLTGRWGRKKVMLLFVFASTVAGFAFARSTSLTEMYAWNFLLSFFSLGAWGVWNTWMGEIYDTRLRGIGYSWGIAAQRVANALAPAVIGAMLVTASFSQTVSFIAMFLAATFVALLFLPETEGHILE